MYVCVCERDRDESVFWIAQNFEDQRISGCSRARVGLLLYIIFKSCKSGKTRNVIPFVLIFVVIFMFEEGFFFRNWEC